MDEYSLRPAVLRRHIVNKMKKRYDPDPLDEAKLVELTPQMAAQARIDYRCAVKTHELLVKCTFLDPRYREELLPEEKALAIALLVEEYKAKGK